MTSYKKDDNIFIHASTELQEKLLLWNAAKLDP